MNEILFVGKHSMTFNVPQHYHTSWELIYCTSGSGEAVFNRRIIPYRERSLLIIPPGISHVNRSQTGLIASPTGHRRVGQGFFHRHDATVGIVGMKNQQLLVLSHR